MAESPAWSVDHQSARGARVLHVRGTLIASSLKALREFGYFERYAAPLEPEQRDAVLLGVANGWLPLEVAMAHYRALVETNGVPMFQFRYFGTATLGIVRGAAGMFARSCFARELRSDGPEQIRLALHWV